VVQTAREAGVKVLLDGQGGDEVFGGYAKFTYANLASLLRRRRFMALAREAASTLLRGDLYVLDLRRGYRYLPGPLRRLFRVDSLLLTVLRADWDEAVAAESTPATRWWRNAGSNTPGAGTLMQRVQIDDITIDTLPQLLRFQDRCSMAFSLEGRMPLLDHRLVEYGVSLPDHLKIQRGWSKYAVRQAMQGLMPDRVRQRTTKLGFSAPDREWLLGELRPQITEFIEEPLRAEAYIDIAALRRWYRTATPENVNTEACLGLFRILALEAWMRAFDVH
jgi:asparagine synthase (glutamine-hydrolysing)